MGLIKCSLMSFNVYPDGLQVVRHGPRSRGRKWRDVRWFDTETAERIGLSVWAWALREAIAEDVMVASVVRVRAWRY